MRQRLLKIWRILRSSFWFQPAVMVFMAALLAAGLGWVDQRLTEGEIVLPTWLSVHGADNIRALLAMIAGSMMTVAGVTFSVVIVALAQASQQFGPRLLHHFMRDRGNQVVLGTFVSTFVYCTLVLGQIHPVAEGSAYVPRISAFVAVLLAIASIGVLIFFFHHVATSIQADQVVLRAADALDNAVRSAFPDPADCDEREPERAKKAEERLEADGGLTLAAQETGYVAAVEVERLQEIAEANDLLIGVEVDGGDFVLTDQTIARVVPSANLEKEGREAILAAVEIVARRSTSRDLNLATDRLAEVAVRALSPGINDPYTAIATIHRLGAALTLLAGRNEPPRLRTSDDETARVLLQPPTYLELLDHAFLQIGHAARGNPLVLGRMVEALTTVASAAKNRSLLDALEKHAETVARLVEKSLDDSRERDDVEDGLRSLARLIRGDAN